MNRPRPLPHPARRTGAIALIVTSLTLLVLGAAGPPVGAAIGPVASAAPALGSPPALAQTATTLAPTGEQNPGIIPAPNSGQAPQDEGERGGWLQSALFFVLCGALLFIALLIWRESRRKLARQRAADPASSSVAP